MRKPERWCEIDWGVMAPSWKEKRSSTWWERREMVSESIQSLAPLIPIVSDGGTRVYAPFLLHMSDWFLIEGRHTVRDLSLAISSLSLRLHSVAIAR